MVRGDSSKAQVALTFDAGSGAEGTEAILAVLREHKVHSTFFLTGDWVKKFPDIARKIVADGHELGNHSFTHPDLREVSDERIVSELTNTEDLIQKITGKSAKPLFRFPFGAYDARSLRVLRKLGYVSIYWTLDSTDWRKESTARSITEQVMGKTSNGFVVVHHASPLKTAEALKTIIPGLKSKGFSLVTVSQLLAN